jgi:mannose-6-phosphate isomerase-like protein (cupin superfamily)
LTAAPRRIVTGNRGGASRVIAVDNGGAFLSTGAGGGIHEIWSSTAADPLGTGTSADVVPAFEPGAGGSSFRLVRIPPDTERWSDPAAAAKAARAIGQERPAHWTMRHPGMHVTSTLDYVLVLEGAPIAVMEEGEIALRPGDVLVQRATPHAWKNPGSAPAVLIVVMIGLTERRTA